MPTLERRALVYFCFSPTYKPVIFFAPAGALSRIAPVSLGLLNFDQPSFLMFPAALAQHFFIDGLQVDRLVVSFQFLNYRLHHLPPDHFSPCYRPSGLPLTESRSFTEN